MLRTLFSTSASVAARFSTNYVYAAPAASCMTRRYLADVAPQDAKSPEGIPLSVLNVPRGSTARFVRALFRSSYQSGEIDQVRNDMKQLHVDAHDRSKKAALEKAATDKLPYSSLVNLLLDELKRRKKIKLLDNICRDFEEICQAHYKEFHLQLTVPKELTKDEAADVEREFKKTVGLTSANTLKMDVRVDPSIIGGRIYFYNNKTYDLSISFIYDAYMKMRLDQVEEDWDAKLADVQAHFDVDSSPSSAKYDAATKEQHEALLHRLGYKQQFRLTQ